MPIFTREEMIKSTKQEATNNITNKRTVTNPSQNMSTHDHTKKEVSTILIEIETTREIQ